MKKDEIIKEESRAAEINSLHAEICGSARTTIEKAIRIGELLTQQKASLQHGEWLPWLKANVEFNERTAQNYMRVFKRRDDLKYETVSYLDLTDAYRLLAGDGRSTGELIVSSKSNEYYTPLIYIESARIVMGGIDLDPSSCEAANVQVQATEYFTKEEDGLTQEWNGKVWVNPPYGRLMGLFTEKLIQEYLSSRIESAILLINAHCTDNKWFQELWEYPICFTNHRIDFINGGEGDHSGSTHGSAFIYFGSNPKVFYEEFRKYGCVVCDMGKLWKKR